MKTKREKKDRILHGEDDKGEFRVTVPHDSKITFGPNVPYRRNSGGYDAGGGYALRVYRGTKDNLVLVLCNVKWFMEENIPYERCIVRREGRSMWENKDGRIRQETVEEANAEWRDAKELKAIPAQTSRHRGPRNQFEPF